MLTKNELQKLREQITLNSLYIADYRNDMGIEEHQCCDFFDGFMDYITELMHEDHPNVKDKDYYDFIWKYDTIENLWNWYCCFEADPLPITELKEAI